MDAGGGQRGEKLPVTDSLLATTALMHYLIVVSHNVAESSCLIPGYEKAGPGDYMDVVFCRMRPIGMLRKSSPSGGVKLRLWDERGHFV